MADTIERTIYKLEIDDSDYIKGVESLSSSTNKFANVQSAANKALQILETALKEQSQALQKAKKDLESYTGADEAYRKQLATTYKQSQSDNQKLIGLVQQSRKEYEAATKAAQDFANTSARANRLQSQPGQRIAPSQAANLNAQIFNAINLPELSAQAEAIALSKKEFEDLADSIQLAEARMKQLNETDEEFQTLKPIVEQGKIALQQYEQAAGGAGEATQSLRTQIRLGREELVRLEEQGKGNSKEYFELEKRVAKLTDAFADQQARIRILSSDTKLLDFGKASITAATSAFQVYTSVSILAGDQSEELQKKTMQLFAAMQLLQSLEQLSNLTRREGALATLAQSGAQSVYTAVVGASTGALRAFRIALLATGVGAAVATIAFLVSKFQQFRDAARAANREQELASDITKEAIKNYTAEASRLEIIKTKLNDLNIPQKQRVAIAKEYNKTAEEGNKIDLKQIDNIALVNQAIDTQIAKLKERALARAAEAVIAQKAEAFLLAQETARTKNLQASIEATKPIAGTGDNLNVIEQEILARKQISFLAKAIEKDPGVIEAKQELDRALKVGSQFITPESLIDPKGIKEKKTTKEVENVFAQKLKELQAKLAEVTAKSFESEGTIRKQFAASLAKEIGDINELVKDKKLTKDQSVILIDLITKINDVQLKEALDQFSKKVKDARKKLNEEILDLQNKNTQDQINLLQDEFERRAALIDFNEKEQLAESKQDTEDRLAALELDKLLIGEQAYQDAKAQIISAGEQEALNIIRKANGERQDLAADLFTRSLDTLSAIFEEQLLQLDETTASKIQTEKALFAQGVINYDEFQKRITKILKDQKSERDKLRLIELNTELAAINKRLEATTDAEEKADLKKRQRSVRKEIADIESETPSNKETPKQIETVQQYAEAIGSLTESIISFWQKANEAEAAALDRSISLQEKRVEAAQRIAERGNASYLKAEEDRLKELQVQRENAARRQLAIDAALQSSQLLVGITGAISKIATPGIGIAETIGAIATIFAALATGYGLVKSLQGNQPRLKKGTKYLQRDGHPSGVDTIPVMANEGEAVIPTEKNKAYHPTVAAIYDGTIPAEDLNNFVRTYHRIKSVPQPNYQRIKEAAESKTTEDGKLASLLSEHSILLRENNELQREIIKKKIHVENKIDRDGVSSMVYDYIDQMRINKRI